MRVRAPLANVVAILVVACGSQHAERHGAAAVVAPNANDPALATQQSSSPEIVVTFHVGHADEERSVNDVDVVVGTTPPQRVHLPDFSIGCDVEDLQWIEAPQGSVLFGCWFGGAGEYVVIAPDGDDRWTMRAFAQVEEIDDETGEGTSRREDERVLLRFTTPRGATLRRAIEYTDPPE